MQAIKVAEQAEIIHQLKEKLNEKDKQIDLIFLLLELEEAQLKVMRDFFHYIVTATAAIWWHGTYVAILKSYKE